MYKLIHFQLCPLSRAIRIALAERGLEVELIAEHPWEWQPTFLALNPAGELPVLQIEDGSALCGAYAISEYLSDEMGESQPELGMVPLFPGNREKRAEVRRLVDWFNGKFYREVTHELLSEKVYARYSPGADPTPNAEILRAIRANLRYHMTYVNYLSHQRSWLAGDELSFADLAAAGQISSVDYLGEVPWEEFGEAKVWYARLKSRRTFRTIMTDRIPGIMPPAHYANLDF